MHQPHARLRASGDECAHARWRVVHGVGRQWWWPELLQPAGRGRSSGTSVPRRQRALERVVACAAGACCCSRAELGAGLGLHHFELFPLPLRAKVRAGSVRVEEVGVRCACRLWALPRHPKDRGESDVRRVLCVASRDERTKKAARSPAVVGRRSTV